MRKQTSSFISLLLAILMCISLLPVGALADGEASTEPEENIDFITK